MKESQTDARTHLSSRGAERREKQILRKVRG